MDGLCELGLGLYVDRGIGLCVGYAVRLMLGLCELGG